MLMLFVLLMIKSRRKEKKRREAHASGDDYMCVCVCAAVNAAKWNRKPEGSSEERKIYGVATRTQQVSDQTQSVGSLD